MSTQIPLMGIHVCYWPANCRYVDAVKSTVTAVCIFSHLPPRPDNGEIPISIVPGQYITASYRGNILRPSHQRSSGRTFLALRPDCKYSPGQLSSCGRTMHHQRLIHVYVTGLISKCCRNTD
jgi:hypothetical protein